MIKTNINKILVPIAISKGGKIAISQALYFHQVFSSRITILHIVPAAYIISRIFKNKEYEQNKKRNQKKLTKFVKFFFKGGIPAYIDLRIIVGELVPIILKTADDQKYDLIIIKKSKKIKGVFYNLRKHNTDRIIGASPCPVLTIKETWTKIGIREILIPLDISKQFRTKIFWAIELALKFKAKIRIISVLRFNIGIEESYTYRKCKILEKWIKGHDIECDIRILKSKEHKMHEAVKFFSKKERPDLTIIMTHQESVMNENYIGRFAAEIIHNCPTPVLSIVPGHDNVFSVLLNSFKIQKVKTITN